MVFLYTKNLSVQDAQRRQIKPVKTRLNHELARARESRAEKRTVANRRRRHRHCRRPPGGGYL